MGKKEDLLSKEPRVISLGLEVFAESLETLGVPVVQVDWRPPAAGDQRLIELLNRLEQGRRSEPEPGLEQTSSEDSR